MGNEYNFEYLQDNLDNAIQVECVYVDFSEAFDKTDTKELISRLLELGVCCLLLHWFESYLCERSEYISVDGFEPRFFILPSGVPQGSQMISLLIIIHTNN